MFRILRSRFRRLKAATDGHALNDDEADELIQTVSLLIKNYFNKLQG